jgi:methionine-rich copper-binding protein CopC
MKLSNETVTVLKNFSTINQNLVINPGNKISTMSAMKNIVAKATVTEEFPQTFAIYDLNEFLSALSLFENPDLNFKDDFVVMTETGSKGKSLKYWYSDPSVVTTLPDKEITMPSSEVSFTFSNNLLSDVTKAAAVIGAPDMCLEAMSLDKAVLKVTDKKNDTANDYAVGVDVTNSDGKDVSYKFWFKVENLRLLPGSYDVNVSSKRISYFKNTSVDVEYFIALEPESKYDA